MRIVIGSFIPDKPGFWSVNLVDDNGNVLIQKALSQFDEEEQSDEN